MEIRLICTLILILMTASTVRADDDPLTPWPVEEDCVAEPTQPPDDWEFEGTIIATGWAGIHGMNAAWNVPHVLASRDSWIDEGGYGTLSPDGRWYVIPQAAFRRTSDIYQGYVDVARLLIYDLTDRQNILRIEWSDTYELLFGSAASRYYTFRTPVWFDENTITYQRGTTYYFIHVPEMTVEVWGYPSEWQDVSPVWVHISHPSPNWSRVVIRTQLFNVQANEIVGEVYHATANIDVPAVAWKPDSTEFIISGALATSLFNADGNLLEVISSTSGDEPDNYTDIRENAYSSDGRLFWLAFYPDRPTHSTRHSLALARRVDHTILDTCIDDTMMSVQFSPDGKYIALLSQASSQQELKIFDIENWQLYDTGIYHQGQIIGWSEN